MGKKSAAKSLWETHPSVGLRVGSDFSLAGFDAASTPGYAGTEKAGVKRMEAVGEELSDLQERLFAEGRSGGTRSVLLVLQGMDTSGKGGIVRHVVGMVDPQGVQHRSFGVPTEEERSHHYLWRIRNALPAPGKIGVFDRSHYEDVLVVRVHDLVPGEPWEERYEEINAFEREVAEAGTSIIKCAMFVSPAEQLNRLGERLARADKHWKFNPGDLDEREHWDEYMAAYEAALRATSTEVAPWHVIPADNKWFARLAISELLLTTLESLHLGWPAADFDVAVEQSRLEAARAAQAQGVPAMRLDGGRS
jgi:PPK2 family polyphosphate:nucleotide phosphotransferase